MKITKSKLKQIIKEELSSYTGRSQRRTTNKLKPHSTTIRGVSDDPPSMSQKVYGTSDDDLDPLSGGMTDPEAQMSVDPANEALETAVSPRETIAKNVSQIAMISKTSLKAADPESLKSNLKKINALADEVSSLLGTMDDTRM